MSVTQCNSTQVRLGFAGSLHILPIIILQENFQCMFFFIFRSVWESYQVHSASKSNDLPTENFLSVYFGLRS